MDGIRAQMLWQVALNKISFGPLPVTSRTVRRGPKPAFTLAKTPSLPTKPTTSNRLNPFFHSLLKGSFSKRCELIRGALS